MTRTVTTERNHPKSFTYEIFWLLVHNVALKMHVLKGFFLLWENLTLQYLKEILKMMSTCFRVTCKNCKINLFDLFLFFHLSHEIIQFYYGIDYLF